jgi:hypothetical protein
MTPGAGKLAYFVQLAAFGLAVLQPCRPFARSIQKTFRNKNLDIFLGGATFASPTTNNDTP